MIKKVIYIGGVARSGTSWIGQIFNSCPSVKFKFQPMFSYEFRDVINEDSSTKDYQNFYKDLYNADSNFLNQSDKVEQGLYPDFNKKEQDALVFKENRFQSFIEPMLRKSDNLFFVGVIRNPNATIYSWSQNEKEFPKGSDILKEWRFANCKNKSNEDYFGFYKWKEVANLYLDLEKKYNNQVSIIHYEKFIENPVEITKQIFAKMNLPYTNQTELFLSNSKQGKDENYYSVYKGSSNRNKWKENLPKYIISEIDSNLKGTRLEQFLE